MFKTIFDIFFSKCFVSFSWIFWNAFQSSCKQNQSRTKFIVENFCRSRNPRTAVSVSWLAVHKILTIIPVGSWYTYRIGTYRYRIRITFSLLFFADLRFTSFAKGFQLHVYIIIISEGTGWCLLGIFFSSIYQFRIYFKGFSKIRTLWVAYPI